MKKETKKNNTIKTIKQKSDHKKKHFDRQSFRNFLIESKFSIFVVIIVICLIYVVTAISAIWNIPYILSNNNNAIETNQLTSINNDTKDRLSQLNSSANSQTYDLSSSRSNPFNGE